MSNISSSVIYLVGIISTVFGIFCGIYFGSNRTLGIWLLFGFLVFALLAGFLNWQNEIWQEQINKNTVAQTEKPAETPKQQNVANDATNSTQYQAGRDINVYSPRERLQPNSRVLRPAKLAALLKPFKGVFVRIENDAQTEAFAEELRSSFKLAELRTNSGDVINDPARFSFEGIKVLVQDTELSSTDSAPKAADTIVKELRQQNFLVNRLPSDAATQENFIRIRIGSIQNQ